MNRFSSTRLRGGVVGAEHQLTPGQADVVQRDGAAIAAPAGTLEGEGEVGGLLGLTAEDVAVALPGGREAGGGGTDAGPSCGPQGLGEVKDLDPGWRRGHQGAAAAGLGVSLQVES